MAHREPLENDAANPCVGCGPEHPTGLRLSFCREGQAVVADLMAEERFQGWPGRLHSGILYLAMLETANWTIYGLHDRVGLPVRTSALETRGWVPVGAVLRLEGRMPRSGGAEAAVEVRATHDGQEVARLTRDYELPRTDTLVRRMGYERLPAVLEGLLPP